MVDKLIKEIEELLNSEISSYKIAKDSGVSYSLISDYRNAKRKIENMTLQVAKKLIRYSEELKMRNYDKMMVIVNELVLEEEDYEKLVFQVNFDDEDLDRNYQFYFSIYDDVVNKNEFWLNLLHNTR